MQSISQASSDAECIVDVESVDDHHHHHHRLNTSTLEISANQSGLKPIFIENDDDEEDENEDDDAMEEADDPSYTNLNTSVVNVEDDEPVTSQRHDDVFDDIYEEN